MNHESDDEHQSATHTQRPPNRRHSRSSIDESLELEHALAQAEESGSDGLLSPNQTALLDPQILADLIVQLREQISHMSSEREELTTFLTACQNRQAELSDELSVSRERETKAKSELEVALKKNDEDAEAITMLRNKVEESRRALIRLQNEAQHAKRASLQFQPGGPLTLDLANAPQSFTPLTGTSFAKQQRTSPPPSIAGSPPPNLSSFLRGGGSDDGSVEYTPSGNDAEGTARGRKLDSLRKELVEARQENTTLRIELHDSKDSRRASEAMVQALREFVASGQASGENALMSPGSISLPPLPSDSGVDEVGDEKPRPASGWGLKLWRKDTSASVTTTGSHASVPSASGSSLSRRKSDASSIAESVTTSAARSGFWARSPPISAAQSPATGLPPASKKFGFLWGGGAAVAAPATPLTPPKEKENSDVPALSPPGSTTEESASIPTSPVSRPAPDLVIQYDDTLSDNESVVSDTPATEL
ncbi:hypothetical protein BKA62DRAFT_688479, partial [Auriculariales sp. MPI-PUGE-AT-0066]